MFMSIFMPKVFLILPLQKSYLAKVYQYLEKSLRKPTLLEKNAKIAPNITLFERF